MQIIKNSQPAGAQFLIIFFVQIRPRVLDVFHACMYLESSGHSEEKVYEVYTQSGLSWSAVSLRTGAAS